MIVRKAPGGPIIIRQGDHAALAAEIAQAWHPPGRPNARPFNSLLVAARHHDAGWRVWEDTSENILDEEGRPRDFLHMPLDDHLTIWRSSITQAARYDLYAGVLVSMHAVALYEGRLASRPDPEADRTRMRAFIEEQIDWQDQMCALMAGRDFYEPHLSEQARTANLRLLQVWDTLSLMLCVPWIGSRTFDGVALPDGNVVELITEADGQGVLAVDPYPLHQNPFPASVQGRKLPADTFGSPTDLAHAYSEAPGVVLNFTLRAT